MFKKQTLPVTVFSLFQVVALLLLLVATTGNIRAGNSFIGAIPVQYVAPKEDLVLDMHRFYQAGEKDELQVEGIPELQASWDPTAFQLRVRVNKEGLYDLVLRVKSGNSILSSVLTVACGQSTQLHRFQVKPPGSATRVAVAGSFNGWNADKNLLAGPDDKGEFSGNVALKPGRYGYKFVIDGKWLSDPRNDQTEDNGLGDKNSVLIVAGEQKEAPVIFADRRKDRTIFVRSGSGESHFQKVSATFEGTAGAHLLPSKESGNSIEVSALPNESGFIRVIAIDQASVPSNVVRCPVGTKEHFLWQDAVLYYAFTDRFMDGDTSNDHPVDNPKVAWPANYHGGDLRGVRQKIDDGYFEKLGVNTIWVAPLNRNPADAYQESPEPHRWYTGYHGYWPVSSDEIDPHIGTARDLTDLVEDAHKHGLRVIADLVLHHVHEQHPWWKEHRDWFGTLDLPDGRKNLRLWDEQQFTTWFEPYLPSFDFSKEAPVRALIDNSVWWANTYKLDGFRLDAVKHVLPSFWWKFRAALRERVKRPADSPLYLVGETFKDRAGIMSFVGPNMLDGQFDFPLYDQIKETFGESSGDMTALENALTASEKAYGKETLMSPLIGNHDKGRFMAYADGELPPAQAGEKEEEIGWKNPPGVREPSNYGKLQLAQAFLMAIDGVPMVYYGDEIGMTGAGDPDNRRDMRFEDKVSPDESRVLENFQKLGAIRRQHPALRYGSRRILIADHDRYAFVRAYFDDRVVAVFNRGKSEAKVEMMVGPELVDGDYLEALSGRSVTVKDGKLETTLPPQTAAFIAKATR
jgi:glycosidase